MGFLLLLFISSFSIVTEALLRGRFQKIIVCRMHGPWSVLSDQFVNIFHEITQWESQYSSE